jgi:hypothetical protein
VFDFHAGPQGIEACLGNKFGVAQELIDEFMALMRQDTVLAQPGQLLAQNPRPG